MSAPLSYVDAVAELEPEPKHHTPLRTFQSICEWFQGGMGWGDEVRLAQVRHIRFGRFRS